MSQPQQVPVDTLETLLQAPSAISVTKLFSTAALTKMAFEGQNLIPLQTKLFIESLQNPANVTALISLSIIEQLKGNQDAGLDYQSAALCQCQLYKTPTNNEPKLRLLVLAAPIHMGGNTPIEFLLEDSDVEITTLYVLPGVALPDPLPEHDLAFVAAPGDSDHSRAFLLDIEEKTQNWPVRLLNDPGMIAQLERDILCQKLSTVDNLIAPTTVFCDRSNLEKIGRGELDVDAVLPEGNWPVVVRPVGSHAGRHLDKLTGPEQIEPYLEVCSDPGFFLTRFIDYRSNDGWFRKYRIVFVNGQAFACHMAISDEWKIWYKDADMIESSSKRSEEERFMTHFEETFGNSHKQTFQDLTNQVGLEYFGIDCAETRDGKLIVFEADNALIIHDMDPKDIFPYKSPQMRKIFKAFENTLLGMADKNE